MKHPAAIISILVIFLSACSGSKYAYQEDYDDIYYVPNKHKETVEPMSQHEIIDPSDYNVQGDPVEESESDYYDGPLYDEYNYVTRVNRYNYYTGFGYFDPFYYGPTWNVGLSYGCPWYLSSFNYGWYGNPYWGPYPYYPYYGYYPRYYDNSVGSGRTVYRGHRGASRASNRNRYADNGLRTPSERSRMMRAPANEQEANWKNDVLIASRNSATRSNSNRVLINNRGKSNNVTSNSVRTVRTSGSTSSRQVNSSTRYTESGSNQSHSSTARNNQQSRVVSKTTQKPVNRAASSSTTQSRNYTRNQSGKTSNTVNRNSHSSTRKPNSGTSRQQTNTGSSRSSKPKTVNRNSSTSAPARTYSKPSSGGSYRNGSSGSYSGGSSGGSGRSSGSTRSGGRR